MIFLCKEVRKIIRQILGTQNIFGYKNTLANQMYLLYCFSGKIYFTNEMNIWIKYLWYVLTFCEMATLYIFALIYFVFEKERDMMMILIIINLVGCSNITSLGFPLIIMIFGKKIETVIKQVDLILSSPSGVDEFVNAKQGRIIVDTKKTFVSFMGLFVVASLIFMFICFFDVVLFYSEDKLKNNFYYMMPIPRIEEHGTFGRFLFFNGISTFAFGMVSFKSVSFLGFVLYWNMACCGVLSHIRDEIDNQMGSLTEEIDHGCGWIINFNKVVRRATARFQEVTLLINSLRTFVEVIASLYTPTGFVYGIAVLYISSSADLQFALKLKYLGIYMATVIGIFQLYWIGENLNHSAAELSLAIYFTPWYWSPKVRKNVYLLLRQTQTLKELKLMKVYELKLNYFSKYVQGVFSYTNVLRKLTIK